MESFRAWLRRLLTICIHSNLVIAVAAVGIAITTTGILSLPLEALPLSFVFLAALFSYTLNRFTDRVEDEANLPRRTAFVNEYGRGLFGVAAIGYGGLLVLTTIVVPRMLPIAILPAVVTVFYGTGLATRVFYVKNGIVGLIWGAIPLGLGLYYEGSVSVGIVFMTGIVVVLLTAAAAIFDIKDIAGDREVGSRTLPVLIGPKRTRYVAQLVVISVLPVILIAATVVDVRFLVLVLYVGYLLLVIPFATPERGPIYYGGVIDGEHILVGLVVALLWVL